MKMNPGRKDSVYIGKIHGERCYVHKKYLLRNLRDVLEILNGPKEIFKEKLGITDFHKVLSIHQKEKTIYFSTGHSWYILLLRDLWEWNVNDKSNTEKKAIQQHHMISPKNTRAIPAMKTALAADVENALRQKYFQDGMKFLL